MCERCRDITKGAPAFCNDCGNDTSPVSGIAEYYMVSNELWATIARRNWKGILCVGCLEKRLGRRLDEFDFGGRGAFPINAADVDAIDNVRSPRLRNRLGWRDGMTHDEQLDRAWKEFPNEVRPSSISDNEAAALEMYR